MFPLLSLILPWLWKLTCDMIINPSAELRKFVILILIKDQGPNAAITLHEYSLHLTILAIFRLGATLGLPGHYCILRSSRRSYIILKGGHTRGVVLQGHVAATCCSDKKTCGVHTEATCRRKCNRDKITTCAQTC